MKIIIRPQELKCAGQWIDKIYGVVLVEKEEDIDPLFKLLCEQDEYWKSYKNLIKVAPKEIDSTSDLIKLCSYCGKTDINDIEEIKAHIPFIIYQYREEEY